MLASVKRCRLFSPIVVACVLALARTAAANVLTTPTVVVNSLQHGYSVGGKTTISTSLSDGIQSTTTSSWTPHLLDPVTWTSTLSAPAGYRFVVTPAAGFGKPTNMSVSSNWSVNGPIGDFTVFFSDTSYTFNGLSGAAPPPGATSSVVGQNLYTFGARANFLVSEAFSFTSITFSTSPPYDLQFFPTQTYFASPRLDLSISSPGSIADATLISLEPVPEPGSLALLTLGGAALVAGQRRKLRRGRLGSAAKKIAR